MAHVPHQLPPHALRRTIKLRIGSCVRRRIEPNCAAGVSAAWLARASLAWHTASIDVLRRSVLPRVHSAARRCTTRVLCIGHTAPYTCWCQSASQRRALPQRPQLARSTCDKQSTSAHSLRQTLTAKYQHCDVPVAVCLSVCLRWNYRCGPLRWARSSANARFVLSDRSVLLGAALSTRAASAVCGTARLKMYSITSTSPPLNERQKSVQCTNMDERTQHRN